VAQSYLQPYVDELLAIEQTVDPILHVSRRSRHASAAVDVGHYLKSNLRNAGARVFQVLDIVTGRAFFVFRGRAY